jgi:two-component system OmpR family sensor kinase
VSRLSWSVGTQLSLALLLVLAAALGIVYLTVVPSLEHRLIDTRVSQLERATASLSDEITQTAPYDSDFVDMGHASTGARVVLLKRLNDNPLVMTTWQDSLGAQGSELTDDPIALRAYRSGRPQRGTVHRGEEDYAEAARPVLGGDFVLLLRDSLQNQFGGVHLVQRRMLLAAGAALLIALLLGYGGARVFARRIRRLERAADRIAGGRFDEPVRDSGRDELGDLARAFERMRVRLAQLDDARRAFVANASHELRTPLFSLAGYLELLDEEEMDEPTRQEFLDSMREQVARLTKLASDLLDLSRLDAGRLTVEREPVDLAAIGEELVAEFGPAAQSGEHVLEPVAGDRALALADELRTFQIGRILVENALRHTPPATTVRVRALERGGKAVLEVEDEGGGIPGEQQEQLFDRFFRLDGARASGSGLGLAIARELAVLMDGTVEVESGAGRTVFRLVLPRPAAVEPREREPAAMV